MTNLTMTNAQKKELINNDTFYAYTVLINQDTYKMFNAFKWVAIKTIEDLDGCATTVETETASKNAMLVMLELGLI